MSIKKAIKVVEQAADKEFEAAKPFLTDTSTRAFHAFWQTLLPTLVLVLTTTSTSDVKTTALSGVTAAGAAALSLIKSAVLAKLKGSN